MNPIVASVELVHGTNEVCLIQHGWVDGTVCCQLTTESQGCVMLCLCEGWKWQFNGKTNYRWWLNSSTKYWGAFTNKTQKVVFFERAWQPNSSTLGSQTWGVSPPKCIPTHGVLALHLGHLEGQQGGKFTPGPWSLWDRNPPKIY